MKKIVVLDGCHTIFNMYGYSKKRLFEKVCITNLEYNFENFNWCLASKASEIFWQENYKSLDVDRKRFWEEYYRIGLREGGICTLARQDLIEHAANSLLPIKYTIEEGAIELLDKLKKYNLSIGIISNWDGHLREVLKDLGILSYFDYIVDSGIVGVEKPDLKIFDCFLEISGFDRTEVLFVGDTYYCDIVGANAAGIEAILYDSVDALDGIFECNRITKLIDTILYLGMQ